MSAETVRGEVVDVVEAGASRPSDHVIFDLRHDESLAQPPVFETPSPIDSPAPAASTQPAPAPRDALHNKIAVVTGGSNGVGREIALRLAAAGARVCVIGGDVAGLRETVEMAGNDAAMVFLQCDVGSVTEIDGVVDFINRFDRPVDLIIHAEHIRVQGTVGTGAVTDLDEQYLINVRGPYVLTQKLLVRLSEASGRVVFLVENGDEAYSQHRMIAEAVRSLADAVRSEAGDRVAVSTVLSGLGVATEVLADVVIDVIDAPPSIEVGEVRLRSRSKNGHDSPLG